MTQIKRLIIIGGPSCVGKTTLIKKIRECDCPHLCEQLGIALPASWLYVEPNRLLGMRQQIIERAVVHYDFTARYPKYSEFECLYKLINNSDSVIILTLCAPPTILIQRITSRLSKQVIALLYKRKGHRRTWQLINILWKKRKIYKNKFKLFALYDKWFNFFNEYRVTRHLLLDSNRSGIMMAHPYEMDKAMMLLGSKETIKN